MAKASSKPLSRASSDLTGAQNVLCGPSGFSHPEWERLHRHELAGKGKHPLDLLVRQFGAVEIVTSFEEHLKPELTRVWARKTEAYPDFRFTVKCHRQFTHDRKLGVDEVQRFKEGILPLHRAGRLGCLLLQFPWSYRYTQENRKHLIELRRAFHEFPIVAEMRHASWMLDEAIGTFIDYRVGFCNIDQPAYTKGMPPTSFLTSSVGYIRLHGRNCFNWFGAAEHVSRTPRYDYLYSESELNEWVRRIDQIRPYARHTFVIANNGTNGKAIANALELQAMVAGEIPLVPKDLATVCRRGPAAQTALFKEFSPRAVA